MRKYSKRKFVKNKRPSGKAKGSRIKKRKSTNRTKNRGKNRKRTMRGGASPTYLDILKKVDPKEHKKLIDNRATSTAVHDGYEPPGAAAEKAFEDERIRLSNQNPELSKEEIESELIDFLKKKKYQKVDLENKREMKKDELRNQLIVEIQKLLFSKDIADKEPAENEGNAALIVDAWHKLPFEYGPYGQARAGPADYPYPPKVDADPHDDEFINGRVTNFWEKLKTEPVSDNNPIKYYLYILDEGEKHYLTTTTKYGNTALKVSSLEAIEELAAKLDAPEGFGQTPTPAPRSRPPPPTPAPRQRPPPTPAPRPGQGN